MKSANQVHKLPQRLGKSIIYAMEKSPARWANMIVYICMPAISKTVPLSVAWAIVFFAVVAADPCFCYGFSMFLDLRFVAFYLHFRVCSPHHPWFVFSRRRRQFCYFPIVATRLFVVRCSAVCLLLSSPPTNFLFPFIVCSSPPSPTRFSVAIFARDGHPSLRPAFFFTKLTMSQSRHKPNATTKSKNKRLTQNTTK